jgi:hypothetical protein
MGKNMLKHNVAVVVVVAAAAVAVVVVVVLVFVFVFVAGTAAPGSISVHIKHGCTNFLKI